MYYIHWKMYMLFNKLLEQLAKHLGKKIKSDPYLMPCMHAKSLRSHPTL